MVLIPEIYKPKLKKKINKSFRNISDFLMLKKIRDPGSAKILKRP